MLWHQWTVKGARLQMLLQFKSLNFYILWIFQIEISQEASDEYLVQTFMVLWLSNFGDPLTLDVVPPVGHISWWSYSGPEVQNNSSSWNRAALVWLNWNSCVGQWIIVLTGSTVWRSATNKSSCFRTEKVVQHWVSKV